MLMLLTTATASSGLQSPLPSAKGQCLPPVSERQFVTDGWKTDFCEHSVPYHEILSGGPPRDGIPPLDRPQFVGVDAADKWLDDGEPVLFFEHGAVARAYPLQIMTWHEIVNDDAQSVNDTLGGAPIVILWNKGTASALDKERISAGRDVGSTGVFRREVDGRILNFSPQNGGFFSDRETQSTWNMLGEAVRGPLTGKKLERVVHHDVFWFVWSAFQPDGRLHDAG